MMSLDCNGMAKLVKCSTLKLAQMGQYIDYYFCWLTEMISLYEHKILGYLLLGYMFLTFSILHFYFLPQKAANAEKSFEALLSHIISELSKEKTVYKMTTEETSMVRLHIITAVRRFLSLSSKTFCLFAVFHFHNRQWIGHYPKRQCSSISFNLLGRYTSQYYHLAVGWLLIKCYWCFTLQLSSSVWSPQSIEFSLQQFCLPFLRLSCLLQHHLYGDNLTGCLVCCIINIIDPILSTYTWVLSWYPVNCRC